MTYHNTGFDPGSGYNSTEKKSTIPEMPSPEVMELFDALFVNYMESGAYTNWWIKKTGEPVDETLRARALASMMKKEPDVEADYTDVEAHIYDFFENLYEDLDQLIEDELAPLTYTHSAFPYEIVKRLKGLSNFEIDHIQSEIGELDSATSEYGVRMFRLPKSLYDLSKPHVYERVRRTNMKNKKESTPKPGKTVTKTLTRPHQINGRTYPAGTTIRVREAAMQHTFGFGGEAPLVKDRFRVSPEIKAQFLKIFAKEFEDTFDSKAPEGRAELALRAFEDNERDPESATVSDIKDFIEDYLENSETYLDEIVKELDEEVEFAADYHASEEYLSGLGYLLPESSFYSGTSIPTEVREAAYEYYSENVTDEEILQLLYDAFELKIDIVHNQYASPSVYNRENDFVVFGSFSESEIEWPLPDELEEKIKRLSDGEVEYLNRHSDAYIDTPVSDRGQILIYVMPDYNAAWYIDAEDAVEYFKETEQ